MKARGRMTGRIALSILGAAAAIALAGCPNLSRDLDLKAQIEEDVREANAEQIPVQVVPESSAMGVTNPSGTTTAKIGVAFQVSTAAYSEYAFVGWEKTAGDGSVSFADPAALETMATITGAGTGIVITARFDARPVVVINSPEGTGALRNTPITLAFSEDVDPATVVVDQSIIVTVSPDLATWSAPTGITFDITVSGSLVTLSPSGMFDPNYYIRVDVLKSITDMAGHLMPQSIYWWFKTGSSDDSEPPTLSALSVKDGATPIDGASTNHSTGLTVSTTATDNMAVTWILVKETDLTTTDFAEIKRSYSSSLAYSLQTAGDGPKRVDVEVLDSANNKSGTLNRTFTLDTVLPTLSSTSINGGAATTTSAAVSVAIGASDDRTGLAQYQLSEAADFSGGTTTAWTAWTPTPGYTMSAGDGAKTVYARVKDAAGNISTEAVLNHDSITLDAQGPAFTSAVVLAGGATTATGTSVSIGFTATDTGSSVAYYRLSEAADFTGGTTTAWTAVPLPTTCTLSSGDGSKTIYVQLRDANGNVSTEGVLNHDSIMLDQQGPAFTSAVVLGGGAAATGSSTVSISIAATDAGSSVAHYRLSEAADFMGGTTTAWTAVPLPTTCTLSGGDGSKTIYVQLRDANGNVSTEGVLNHDSITLDQAGPTFSSGVVLGGGATYAGSTTVSIGITATDASSAIAFYRLSEAADFTGGTTTSWTAVPLPTTCSLSTGSGLKTIYVQLRDSVGNVSTETSLNHDSITLDQQVPTFASQVSINGGAALATSSTVSLSIQGSDALSGIEHYQLSEAADFGGGTTTAWTPWTGSPQAAPFVLSADGSRTVYVRLRDFMGNISTDTTLNHDDITLDAAGPTFSSAVSINSAATSTTSTTVSVAISATDAGSSIAQYELAETSAFTGPTATGWLSWSGSPVSFTLTSGDGAKNVYVRLRDANGNVSTEATLNHDSISLDQDAPTFSAQVSINGGAAGTKNATVSVAVAASDTGSSIAQYELAETAGFTGPTATGWLSWSGSPVSFTLTSGDGAKNVYVRLRDANSHVSTEASLNHDDIVLDTAAPQITGITFAADNSSAVVTFNEDIYGDAVMGPLAADALKVVVKSGSGVVLLSSTSRTGAAEATVTMGWFPPPATGDSVAIQANTAASVYDGVGNAMAANAGMDGTAKKLSFGAGGTAGGSSAAAGAVQAVASAFRGGSFDFPSARASATVAAPRSTPPVAADVPRTQATVQPFTQFHRPVIADAHVAPAEEAAVLVGPAVAIPAVQPAAPQARAAPTPRAAQASVPELAALASVDIAPVQDPRPASPWLPLGLAFGAGLLLAGGLLARQLVRRSRAAR